MDVKLDTATNTWSRIYDLIYSEATGKILNGPEVDGAVLYVGNPPAQHKLTVVKNYTGIEKLPDTFKVDVAYTDAEGKLQPNKELTVANGTPEAGKVTWTMDIPYGSNVTVSETGYEVARYSVVPAETQTFTMPDSDYPVTLVNAYTEQEKINVTYDKNTGSEGDKATTPIYRGDDEPAQPADPTREGYTFGGWKRSVDADGNVIYKAHWIENPPEPGEVTITYKDGDKTVVTKTIKAGEKEPEQPEDPEKQEGKTFAGWDKKQDDDGNITYTARWVDDPVADEITITYKDGDKTVVTKTIKVGEKEPEQPEDPEKQEGKTFAGWDKKQDDDGNITYTARWVDDPDPEKIKVTYDPANGSTSTVFDSIKGENEPVQPAPPEREGYTFGGWLRKQDADGNVTYTANWIEIKKDPEVRKTVTYIDPMAENAKVKSGYTDNAEDMKEPEGTPSHESMQFTGWKEVTDNEGNIVKYASYKVDCENPQNKILVRYRSLNDGKEEVYQTSYIEDIKDEPAAPATPVRDGYEFVDWSREEIKDADGNVTDIIYTANWKEIEKPVEKTHWVTYVDPDGTTIYLEKVVLKEGEAEPAAPKDPSKEGYDFDGWEESTDSDGNKTYTARWKEKTPEPEKTHTVKYVDPDGKTVYLDPVTVKAGEKEPAAPSDPKKDNNIFGGWERSTDNDGNVTYTAKWLPVTHTVTFVDGRTGEVLDKATDVPMHGNVDTVPGAKSHDGYEFKGWISSVDGKLITDLSKVTDVTADQVYTAVYEPVVKPAPVVHTVTFIDAKTGEELKIDTKVSDGGSTATPNVPEHEGYVFKGWWTPDNKLVTELEVENVREDQTYVALYDRVYQEAITGKRIIHFRYIDADGREVEDDRIDTVRFTRTATVDAITGETTFSEWTPRYHTFPAEDVPEVEGFTTDDTIPEQTVWPNGENEELWVIYTPVRQYETKTVSRTVQFRYYTADGEKVFDDVVQTVTLTRSFTLDPDTKERVYTDWEITGREHEDVAIPEKEGFIHDLEKIDDFVVDLTDPKDGGDVVVIYSKPVEKTFTVTFEDGEGNVLKVHEGITEHGSAEAPEDPTREGYTFAGWDREFDDITGDLKVVAKWTAVPGTHTVEYVDEDGTVYLDKVTINDGDPEPEQPKDLVKAGFTFGGWSRSVDDEGNVTYTARWVKDGEEDTETIWVTYVDEDGNEYLVKSTINKGDKEPDAPADPKKEGFVFGGWIRTVDAHGNVTYTAKWVAESEPGNTEKASETEKSAEQSQTTTPVAVPKGANSTVITNPVTGQTSRVFSPETAASPATGDANENLIWIIAAIAAGAGIAAAAVMRRRRRED